MKTISTLIIFLSLSSASFSQTYNIYTAKADGNFGVASTWNVAVRNDNVKQDKYVIGAGFTVTADKDTDYEALGDMQIIIGGKLKMGPSAEMKLTNNSSIQLLAGATVQGNGGSQIIIIGSVTQYQGNKDGTITGPLFADKTTSGFSLFTTLPVEFIFFTAAKNSDNTITLKWSVTAEVNNSHFDVEFSSNGRDWSKVGSVNAAAGTNRISNYAFSHKAASSAASYRLKQVDKDGSFNYSPVVVIKNIASDIAIYAANKTVNIELSGANRSSVVVTVLNAGGQVIKRASFNQASGKIALNLNGLKNGNYVVQVSDNSAINTAKSVMLF